MKGKSRMIARQSLDMSGYMDRGRYPGGRTHVDVLSEQLVGCPVFLQDVAVDGAAGQYTSEQETKKTKRMSRSASDSLFGYAIVAEANSRAPICVGKYLVFDIPSSESAHGFARRQGRRIGHAPSGGVEAARREQRTAGAAGEYS